MVPLFTRPQSWGGTEEGLLAQDDLYRLLGIAEFEGRTTIPIAELSIDANVELEVPDHLVVMLRAALVQPGQDPTAARIVAGVVRRLREGS